MIISVEEECDAPRNKCSLNVYFFLIVLLIYKRAGVKQQLTDLLRNNKHFYLDFY